MPTDLSTIRRQTASQAKASNKFETWTTAELDLIADTMADDAALVAEVLGRTLYAITTMRKLVRAGGKAEAAVKRAHAPATGTGTRLYRGWVEGDSDE